MSTTRRYVTIGVLESIGCVAVIVAVNVLGNAHFDVVAVSGIAVALVAGINLEFRIGDPDALHAPLPPRVEDEFAAHRPFARLVVLRASLRRGFDSPQHFEQTLWPLLRELVDDRLRRRFGIATGLGSDDAKRVLGPDLSSLETSPGVAAESPEALDQLLDHLEAR